MAAAALAGPGTVRVLVVGTAVLFFGVARAASSEATAPPDQLADLAGTVTLVGRIADAPTSQSDRIAFPLDVVRVRQPEPAREMSPGALPRVQVRAMNGPLEYGDLVEVRGRLAAPRSRPGFPEAELLARRGIARVLDGGAVRVREKADVSGYGLLYRLRGALESSLRSALPEPHASLTAGILLGTKAGFPAELRAALTVTGTSHIVAVSGFNVVIVAAVVNVVAVRLFGRAWALVPMLAAVWAYIALVGAPPSGVRAALMASLVFVASAVGRLPDRITTLGVAVAAMLAWDPSLLSDLGFQLSVAATAGLVLFAHRIAERLPLLPGPLRAALAPALAAELATLPIAIATFHTLPLVSPLANLLVGFTVPLIMLFGALLAVLTPLPGLDALLAWPTWGLTAYFLTAIDWVADVPGAVVYTGRLPVWLLVAWYLVLVVWAAEASADVRALFGHRRLHRAGLLTATLAVVPASAVLSVPPTDRLTVSFLDVGGPSAFIRDPAGRSALVGGGASATSLATSVARRLGFWERRLDLAVLTRGADRERAAAIETLRRYPATLVLGPPPAAEETEGEAGPGRSATTWLTAEPGQRMELGENIWLEIVDVRVHEEHAVLDVQLVIGALEVWLPGPGPPSPRWRDVTVADREVILRMAGRSTSWLRDAPNVTWRAVVTDLPLVSPSTELGGPVLDLRTFGAVELDFDGVALSVRTERCPSGRGCVVVP